MKLMEAILNVDKSKPNTWLSFEDLCIALGLHGYWDSEPKDMQSRLVGYDIVQWYCTDTHVGLTAVYFDGEPAATIWQTSRKGDREWKFVSADIAKKIYDWIVNNKELKFDLLDPEEEIGETFTVEYNDQLLTNKGVYKGKPVTVIKRFTEIDLWEKVIIQDDAGKSKIIDLKDFKIPFNMAKK